MRQFLVLLICAVAASAANPTAFAWQGQRAASPAPVADTFEDGDNRLRLVGLPAPDGAGMSVTLVYEDAGREFARSITVDPDLVRGGRSEAFEAFVAEMDQDFFSYVRAMLADRILHLRDEPSALDVAEASLFFRRKLGDLRQARLTADMEDGRTAE